jgi:hypothetical protein
MVDGLKYEQLMSMSKEIKEMTGADIVKDFNIDFKMFETNTKESWDAEKK